MICNYPVTVDFDHGTRMTLIIRISTDIFYRNNTFNPMFKFLFIDFKK